MTFFLSTFWPSWLRATTEAKTLSFAMGMWNMPRTCYGCKRATVPDNDGTTITNRTAKRGRTTIEEVYLSRILAELRWKLAALARRYNLDTVVSGFPAGCASHSIGSTCVSA